VIALAGGATYLGLEHYLEKSLDESLTTEARTIAQTLLINIRQSGNEYVINEINEHFAPEINGRFVRVTRGDGQVLFVSGTPKDKTFDPAAVRSLGSVSREHSQEVDVGDDRELLLHVLPYTNRDGDLKQNYFEVEKYPEMTFKGAKVEKRGDQWVATGPLQIKDVTKTDEIPFEVTAATTPRGPALGASGSVTVNRNDYNVKKASFSDNGSIVGNDIKIELNVEAYPPKAAEKK
jgi:hypothetical protein